MVYYAGSANIWMRYNYKTESLKKSVISEYLINKFILGTINSWTSPCSPVMHHNKYPFLKRRMDRWASFACFWSQKSCLVHYWSFYQYQLGDLIPRLNLGKLECQNLGCPVSCMAHTILPNITAEHGLLNIIIFHADTLRISGFM